MNHIQNLTAATPDIVRRHVQTTVQSLLEKCCRGLDVCDELLECRQLLESLPSSTSEFGVAVLRLRNAHRYLVSDERSAAQYELRLLEGSLRNRQKMAPEPKLRMRTPPSDRIQGGAEAP